MHRIMTVDVWDTLLRRDCHPECIKLETARHLFLGWKDHLLPDFQKISALYDARLSSERNLAELSKSEGKDDEYEITSVLAHWTSAVFSHKVPDDLPRDLAKFELSVEVNRSYVDPGISLFLRSFKCQTTFFLSDFYMNGKMLRQLLASKGLDTLVPDGYSSCDIGLNKRSGKIFHYIHSLHAVSPKEHLHIGDNEWSDVASPSKIGIQAVHYQPASSHEKRLTHEHLFSSREVLFDHLSLETSGLAKKASSDMPAKQAAAFDLGVQAAPLFIGFALWIAEQSLLRNIDQLCFFTREGEFFHSVFHTLFPQNQLSGHDLPPANILEVSRLSTFAPSIKEVNIQEMSRIWSLFKVQSISGFFITLVLDIAKFSYLLDSLELKETDVIHNPQRSPELRQLFERPEFVDALKSVLSSRANILKRYLIQSGVTTKKRVGIIDIGWRGTIQDNISLLMPDTHFYGMYLGLRSYINPQPANASKAAYGPDENISEEQSALFSNFSAMEMLCNSRHGSVVGYQDEGGTIKPQRDINAEENAAYSDFVEPFQQGVLFAAQHWSSYLERYVVSSTELNKMALHIWDKLRRSPAEGLVEVYLQTPQHDVFGYGETFHRNRYPSIATVFLSPFIGKRRRTLIEFIRRVQWSEAIENAKGISRLHRKVLLIAFRGANWIKRSKLNSTHTGRTK